MNDSEMRGLVLRRFYDLRHDPAQRMVGANAFEDLGLPEHVLANIVEQLQQQGLAEGKTLRGGGAIVAFMGRISAAGIDVIEGKRSSPISITIDNSVNVHGSQNIQIGGSENTQNVTMDIQKMISLIDSSGASIAEKEEAKSLLSKLKDNPLVQWALTKWFSGGASP